MIKPFVTQPANCVTTASTRAYLFICSSELRIVWTRVRHRFVHMDQHVRTPQSRSIMPGSLRRGALSFDAFCQKKRIYMKSHLLTEARTQKLICSLRRKGLDVTAERRESAMNSVMFRILIVSRILSQWKVPHINPRCGIVILTLKNDSGNRE